MAPFHPSHFFKIATLQVITCAQGDLVEPTYNFKYLLESHVIPSEILSPASVLLFIIHSSEESREPLAILIETHDGMARS